MKYQLMFRKLAISLILATITPLIWANKSQTQTLVDDNFIVFLSEDTTQLKPLNINSSTLITQKFRNFSKLHSQPIIIAQFTVGTIIPILVIVIIGGLVLIFFIWKAKLFLLIGKDEVGIVDKKWDFNLSLRLPPGRIIALNGEPGIQAKILEPGPHFGYFSWQYTITKVPVITISKEEIGLVEARDGLPLEPGQNFAKIVDCNNFQDIKAFFDNGGQIGKQRAILTNGTYRINTEIFRCHQVSVTRIEAHQIGLVEALDGSPLKPGNTDDSGKVVKRYQAIRNLVSRVLTKVVSSYFQQAATGLTAMDFQDTRGNLQQAAQAYIEECLKDISVEGCGTVIDTIDLPQELDEYRQRLEKQKQEAKEAQEESKTILEIEKAKAQIEQLRLDTYQKRLDIEIFQKERISLIEINALKEQIAALSPELYAQIETQGKWAEAMAQIKIDYPQIMMTGERSTYYKMGSKLMTIKPRIEIFG